MQHGPLRGFALATARVFRCSSLFTGGYDPVPTQFSFEAIREGYREFREVRRRPGLLRRIQLRGRRRGRREGN